MLLAITIFLAQRQRALITIDEAIAAAEAQFVEARAVEVNLKTKYGTQVYEVYLNNGIEVRVDAHSGSIVKMSIKGDVKNEN